MRFRLDFQGIGSASCDTSAAHLHNYASATCPPSDPNGSHEVVAKDWIEVDLNQDQSFQLQFGLVLLLLWFRCPLEIPEYHNI